MVALVDSAGLVLGVRLCRRDHAEFGEVALAAARVLGYAGARWEVIESGIAGQMALIEIAGARS